MSEILPIVPTPLIEISDARQPIDMEELLHWAIDQSNGYLPWRGVNPRELMLDGGYNVVPKGVSREYQGLGPMLRRTLRADANLVIDAVKALEPRIAAIVIANAREKRRPDWMAGVEPKLVQKKLPKPTSEKKIKKNRRRKRKHKAKVMVTVWDIDPTKVFLVRQRYEAWHHAVTALMAQLRDRLDGYRITEFSAPATPWLKS